MQQRFFSTPVSAPNLANALLAAAPEVDPLPQHDPPLEPRDDAVFLLTAAAEIEHALMVQYLFAAYSLRLDAPSLSDAERTELRDVQRTLIGIAREEMAHLLTIQNLLHLVGGPLNFNREQAPYASEIYPFRFKLEAVSLDSLAKYVFAESPLEWPVEIGASERAEIGLRAQRSNDNVPVRHVGRIFASLQTLFEAGLADADFRLDTLGMQGGAEWGSDPLLVRTFGGADAAKARQDALAALADIARQGEGHENENGSHFERFLRVFRTFKKLSGSGQPLTWPVADNPNTTRAQNAADCGASMYAALAEANARQGRITDERARDWAQLFNLRYRMLLAHLSHYLRLDQAQGDAQQKAQVRAQREHLKDWSFNEMTVRLGPIALQLVQMPKDDPPGVLNAGPPFELPYTLNLPQREADRWRTQLDIAKASQALAQRLKVPNQPDDILDGLLDADAQREIAELQALANGQNPFTDDENKQGPVHFETHIRPLFRPFDRNFMIGRGLDLHDFNAVSNRAAEILDQVASGNMPCDAPWPAERVALFRQWITEGKQR